MYAGFSTRKIHRFSVWFLLILLTCSVSPASAGSISKQEKAAYTKLAGHVPAAASFSVIMADLRQTITSVDAILQKYKSVDPEFRYEQFIFSLRGGLGFNPLSAKELSDAGFDLDFGGVAFSLSQDSVPMIVARAANVEKTQATLKNLVEQMAQSKACPDRKVGELTVHGFSQDGLCTGAVDLAYVIQDQLIYLMGQPKDSAQFDKHLNSVVKLKKAKSLASDRMFIKMLGRLDNQTSLVSYNNYKRYVKDLKQNARRAQSELRQQLGDSANTPYVDMLEDIVGMAEGFGGQIFAVSIKPQGVSFVHELIGNKKKIAKFKGFFQRSGPTVMSALKLKSDPIGTLYGTVNFNAIKKHLFTISPRFKKQFATWKQDVMTQTKLDLEKDFIQNANGEMAVLFYGLNPMPPAITQASTVTDNDMVGLAKLVLMAGIKDVPRTKHLLQTLKDMLTKQGKVAGEITTATGDNFLNLNLDGVPVQLGIIGKAFMVAVGTDAINHVLDPAGKLNLASNGKVAGDMALDFQRLGQTMENLKPPADSPNTQLHQQYQVWKTQAAGKIAFIKDLKIQSLQIPDGFRTQGELRF